ncbi:MULTISPECIES: phage holin family protein [Enterococcus]|uniref:Holin n=1 Tax=Candidatus Enterococcus mangumiae TaxID=2230878 RepID=A0ABZ2T0L0_9ENTE|nr:MULTISPECIES: phage holin family protein [unclassified Enterococcus]MBO0461321.1 phage holin family protein [Enterococcus sp. DIV1298c]MBO0491151.1 phage holin family protein [Enterococcus sp. DIV1094]MBO1301309.1 phage holin family protein [Enterococcus sp. DIV1271a]
MIVDNAVVLNEFKNLGSNVYIQIFLLILCIDFISGICLKTEKKKRSKQSFLKDLVKYVMIFLIVAIAYPYLKITGFEAIGIALVFSYCAIYGLSVIENLRKLGIPVPEFVKVRLKKWRDFSEEQGRSKK